MPIVRDSLLVFSRALGKVVIHVHGVVDGSARRR